MLEFLLWEHFFQAFLVMILGIYGIGLVIVDGVVKKYPEMLIDGLSIFKILLSFFKKKYSVVEKLDNHTDKVDDIFEKYEDKYDAFIHKIFYPWPIVLSISIVFGYMFYYFTEIESLIIFNLGSIFIVYFSVRLYSKYFENKNKKILLK